MPLEISRRTGVPIGNLTSQLFANVYMDAFDHYVKDTLQERCYIRYTDDVVVVHEDREHLADLLSEAESWLWKYRKLTIHPKKQEIRKFSQGVDFLGYVLLPHHRVLRTKTKRRVLERVHVGNLPSYQGVLKHCNGYELECRIVSSIDENDNSW